MYLEPPWALFVLDGSIDNAYLDDCLTRACTTWEPFGWVFWVATTHYSDIPLSKERPNKMFPATQPPLPELFTSPWEGKTIEDCAKWLAGAPAGVDIHTEYFNVLDKHSKEDDTVLVCRWKWGPHGEILVEYFPQPTNEVGMQMWTNGGTEWRAKASDYRKKRAMEEKPDRSRVMAGFG